MYQFRLLHLSDLHFAEKPRVAGFPNVISRPPGWLASHDPDLALKAAEYAYREQNNLHAIVLTGDIATSGARNDLRAARAFVDAPAISAHLTANGEGTLKAANLPIALIPGNHDRFHDWPYHPGRKSFDGEFQDYWPSGKKVTTLLVLRGSSEHLALIAADLSLVRFQHAQGWSGFEYLGQGKAYRRLVNNLVRETAMQRQAYGDQLGVVWLIHFPPGFPHISSMLRLLDEQILLAGAASAGVTDLFLGHTHEANSYQVGALNMHCAGTATQYASSSGNSIHVREVTVSGSQTQVQSTDLSWNRGSLSWQ